MTMFAQIFGAAREVTGSFHVLHTDKSRILLDCGLFQGRRKEAEAKNRALPIDPAILTNCVLSHAHLDHSGRIPMLCKGGGFAGQIFTTTTTADACAYLLKDSAKIQENDAAYLNYKTVRNFLGGVTKDGPKMSDAKRREVKAVLKSSEARLNEEVIARLQEQHHLERIEPLYSIEDVEACLPCFTGFAYRQPFAVAEDVSCTLYDAGHILGSAITILTVTSGDSRKNILFSGDVGRFGKPIVLDPTLDFAEEHREIDLMIMESTYGDRHHEDDGNLKEMLRQALTETFDRGGSVIIPAFAYGRTQELIYFLHELYMENAVRPVPVYIDSPLATNITNVFGRHQENFDSDTQQEFLKKGINPFAFEHLHFVESVEESMAINREQKSHIVIAGSGMCEGGRVLHHLRFRIHDDRNTILIVGYMGQNTFGHLLQAKAAEYEEGGRQGQAPMVRFYNKEYPLRAHVVTLGGFSAHGDYEELLRVIGQSNLHVKKIALVHGEEEQIFPFQKRLQDLGYAVTVPRQGESVTVEE